MDHSPLAFQVGADAERMRMNSFKLGKPQSPPTASMAIKSSRHSRSHSRNSSVSTSLSFPHPPTVPSPTPMNDAPPQSPTRSSIGGAKRNSHHRRRSSVSTRCESADMMGVPLPAIPVSSSEDNINFGDKDSVRRHALWALEGKTPAGNFSVEIPELDAPEVPKRSFDFSLKPSFPPGVGAGFSGGLNTMMESKHDSRIMASSSLSELLGTLVEEEEEEDKELEDEEPNVIASSPVQDSPVVSQVAVTVSSPSPATARHRPTSLKLRPLSLTLSSSIQASNGEMPTSSPVPGPPSALKSLTLSSMQGVAGLSSNSAANKHRSLVMSSSPILPSSALGRRPSLNLSMDGTGVSPQPSQRSSISYVSSGDAQPVSVYGLPTPEMTPTSSMVDRRRSTSTSSTSSFDMNQLRGRPLSTSEQHFLFQAHQTLVQHITDLERALKRSSSRSRPALCASEASEAPKGSAAPSEPTDEMLQLIADLKAERDELKKDVNGWRSRVADMEHQIDVHTRRLKVERRDAWVARQRFGLIEVEKNALERTLSQKTAQAEEAQAKCDAVQHELEKSQQEVVRLTARVELMGAAKDELTHLRADLLQERKKRKEMERELEHAGLLDTPRPFSVATTNAVTRKSRGLGFHSIDLESSFTDVDSVDETRSPELKAVLEVDEDDDESAYDDDDNELSRYEDEDENDEYAFPTCSSATPRLSQDSVDSAPELTVSRSPSASPSPLPSPAEPTHPPAHARHVSLSRAWSFPRSSFNTVAAQSWPEEIDRFFGCLEDVDNSPPMDSKLRSAESRKNLFAQALADYEDDMPPFMIPSDVGEVVVSPEIEEEEEEEQQQQAKPADDTRQINGNEFVGEKDEGGIKFVFDPPPSEYCVASDTSMSSSTDMNTPDLTMVSSPSREASPAISLSPLMKKTRWSSIKVASPMSLPRLCSSPSGFSTPSPKRISSAPTFIPHPRASIPLTPFSSSPGKVASFIPQPRRASASASPRPSVIPIMTPPMSSRLPSSVSYVSPPPAPLHPGPLPRLQL
ncbi:hypothetical protein BD413DRAFT_604322 [Trametes elegans]|nr:hypothetical protein BD413DRAFT_604322 [Trametes elegans]